MMQYTDQNVIAIRGNYLTQLFLLSLFTFIVISFEVRPPPALYILLIVILAGGMCISAFFGIMRWEHHYAGEGLALSAADRLRRIVGIGILIVSSIVVAILLSSDNSILSFSLISGFLTWLFGLFRRFILPREPLPSEVIEHMIPAPPNIPLIDMLPEEAAPWPVWRWIRYGFIAFIALLFIWFMISPLLNRGSNPDNLPVFKRLRFFFEGLFKKITETLIYIFSLFKTGTSLRKRRKPNADEIRRAAENLLGVYSLAKKRDMKHSVTLFARLIIWGDEVRHVTWKSSHGPGEYCRILAATESASENINILQKQNEGIIRCGEIFEKALYSAEELSNEERKEFKDLVEEITSEEDNPKGAVQ
jgi:hypothetical protein